MKFYIETFGCTPKGDRFLHLPLQSGSNRILKAMGRRYTSEDFLKIAEAFRSAFPDLTLITDVIVGFPGETEDDFLQTADLIALLQPDKVNITRFSPRLGTAAANGTTCLTASKRTGRER